MNLQKCKAHNDTIIKVPCCNCTSVKEISKMFADLDGEAFRSYYCEDCKQEIINNNKQNKKKPIFMKYSNI